MILRTTLIAVIAALATFTSTGAAVGPAHADAAVSGTEMSRDA